MLKLFYPPFPTTRKNLAFRAKGPLLSQDFEIRGILTKNVSEVTESPSKEMSFRFSFRSNLFDALLNRLKPPSRSAFLSH